MSLAWSCRGLSTWKVESSSPFLNWNVCQSVYNYTKKLGEIQTTNANSKLMGVRKPDLRSFYSIVRNTDILQVCSPAEFIIMSNMRFNTLLSLISLHCDIAIAQLSKTMNSVVFKFRDSLFKSTLRCNPFAAACNTWLSSANKIHATVQKPTAK